VQCPTDPAAASQVGCVGPFSTYANNFLDLIFTGAFGMVGTYLHIILESLRRFSDKSISTGLDVALILATTMLSKSRAEKERYRHIDEKDGVGAI
jgi:hypothetical protein